MSTRWFCTLLAFGQTVNAVLSLLHLSEWGPSTPVAMTALAGFMWGLTLSAWFDDRFKTR